MESRGRFLAFRLMPGTDLIEGLQAVRAEAGARAMAIVTCVGSLTRCRLRHADRDAGTAYDGRFEIVSLVGTVDPQGQHLHLSLADGDGRVRGGHLLPGSAIHTTAEVVAVSLEDVAFAREGCAVSGYRELVVRGVTSR
ncbi:DNA-binding protein [Jannaschia sp. LMIT008]|uniref:PPC domain-containing DNA-binding protein n=1 Tax=Jannaschia maritima TaxID=3032585 RepID=UPI0028113E1D|nr:DNA-binding protein [Jannaschia sp. LMIT008]